MTFSRVQGTYTERAAQIGEHWTFFMGRIEVLVPVDQVGGESMSSDAYFKAKQAAQATYRRAFGRYPERSDVVSTPAESRKNDFPEGLDAFAVLADQPEVSA